MLTTSTLVAELVYCTTDPNYGFDWIKSKYSTSGYLQVVTVHETMLQLETASPQPNNARRYTYALLHTHRRALPVLAGDFEQRSFVALRRERKEKVECEKLIRRNTFGAIIASKSIHKYFVSVVVSGDFNSFIEKSYM